MAPHGKPAADPPTTVVRHFTPDEVRRLVEAAVGLHNQMAVAAAEWFAAPRDDHAAGQWGRHTAAVRALWAAIQQFQNVDAVVSGRGYATLRTRRLLRPLAELMDGLINLREGTTGPLLRQRPVGGTKAPTPAEWQRRCVITNAVEMAKRSGMTYPEACQHVAAMLPEKPTTVVVEWTRKQVRKRATAQPGASELQHHADFAAGWPHLKQLAEQAAAKEGTTWQAVVRRGIPAVLGIVA